MKKQTAGNNEFLWEVKQTFSKGIFKKISVIVNEKGIEAGKAELEQIKKYI